MAAKNDRALLVAIDRYPEMPLHWCLNDVQKHMLPFLVERCGFDAPNIRLVFDASATAERMLAHLDWLVKDMEPGCRRLFHYSGHGSQVTTEDAHEEPDGVDEVLCPVDYPRAMIRDKTFIHRFRDVPANACVNVVLDSCFSGGMSRDLIEGAVPRAYPVPFDVQWAINSAAMLGLPFHGLREALRGLNVGFALACQERQTAADNGFTPAFVRTLSASEWYTQRSGNVPTLREIVEATAKQMEKEGFAQVPLADGAGADRPFLYPDPPIPGA